MATAAIAPGLDVSWPSHSPFVLDDIGGGPCDHPPTIARGRLYLPPGATADWGRFLAAVFGGPGR